MFNSARSKVCRSQKHILDLEEAFQAFAKREPYTVLVEDYSEGRTAVRLKLTEPVPDELGLMIGDAIHNLRCALDHATWELIGLDHGQRDRYTKLPTGSNRKDYEASCRGLKTPRKDTKQFFVDLAIHPTGPGATIYTLNDLDNTDKHKIITPLIAVGTILSARAINEDDGLSLLFDDSITVHFDHGGNGNFMLFGVGVRLEMDDDAKIVPEIFLKDWQGMNCIPAIAALTMLVEDVTIILDAFAAFAKERNPIG